MQVKIAKTYFARLRGLIGSRLGPDEALLIPHCRQVHTFFMSYPIDIVFLDKAMRVISIHTLSPWRISPLILGSFYALELPKGGAKKQGIEVGRLLDISL